MNSTVRNLLLQVVGTATLLSGCCLTCHVYDKNGVALVKYSDGSFYVEVTGSTYRRMGCAEIAKCPELTKLMRGKIENEITCPESYTLNTPRNGYRDWIEADGYCHKP